MKKGKIKLPGLIIIALIIMVSCQENERTDDKFGILRISITDDPFPIEYIEEANITITKVEIRTTDDSNGYPFITLLEETREFDLLELRNGVVAELLEMEIPVGDYDLLRLYVDEASIVVDNNGTLEDYKVKVPSGEQTGIKIFIEPPLSVQGGLTSELLLDFSLEKSFVIQGNMNTPAGIKGFIFKPVIRAVNNSFAGTVQGVVSEKETEELIENASLGIIAEDDTLATAFSDENGFYAMTGITEGSYLIYAFKENYDTVHANIEVKAANLTIQDFILTPKE
ncbi:MAG: DUF4382 domain-containing protein [Bacteroidales bacterium]|nr:DUF4382 domain-containing protein [Bacteroidales bacterium]